MRAVTFRSKTSIPKARGNDSRVCNVGVLPRLRSISGRGQVRGVSKCNKLGTAALGNTTGLRGDEGGLYGAG